MVNGRAQTRGDDAAMDILESTIFTYIYITLMKLLHSPQSAKSQFTAMTYYQGSGGGVSSNGGGATVPTVGTTRRSL